MTETIRTLPTVLGDLRVHLPVETPDLLLWPGVLFDSRLHRPLQAALAARGVDAALVEPPGFAGSTLTRRDLDMRDCGRAYIDLLDGLGLERAVLGGTSWGGATACFAALHAPERVEALVLMNAPYHKGPKTGLLSVAHRLVERVPPALFATAGMRDALPLHRMAELGPRTIAMMRGALRSAHPADRRAVARCVFRDAPGLYDALPGIEAPALLIAGHLDRLCWLAGQRKAAGLLPDARLVELPRSGHLSALEAPEIVAAEISTFLMQRPEGALP